MGGGGRVAVASAAADGCTCPIRAGLVIARCIGAGAVSERIRSERDIARGRFRCGDRPDVRAASTVKRETFKPVRTGGRRGARARETGAEVEGARLWVRL